MVVAAKEEVYLKNGAFAEGQLKIEEVYVQYDSPILYRVVEVLTDKKYIGVAHSNTEDIFIPIDNADELLKINSNRIKVRQLFVMKRPYVLISTYIDGEFKYRTLNEEELRVYEEDLKLLDMYVYEE